MRTASLSFAAFSRQMNQPTSGFRSSTSGIPAIHTSVPLIVLYSVITMIRYRCCSFLLHPASSSLTHHSCFIQHPHHSLIIPASSSILITHSSFLLHSASSSLTHHSCFIQHHHHSLIIPASSHYHNSLIKINLFPVSQKKRHWKLYRRGKRRE